MNGYQGKFQKKGAPRKRKNPATVILLAVAAVLFSLLVGLGVNWWQGRRAQQEFDRLAAMTHTEPAPTVPPTTQATIPPTTQATEAPTEPTEPEPEILPQYQELSQQNPDLWGWLTIPDTKIDYPVMYTPQEPEKYLYADFSGSYSYSGTPFLDEFCTPESDNLLIYAHNMNNGTMFRPLLKYDSVTYCRSHPVIQLNTLYEEREYEVMAAFYDRVYYAREDAFKFYKFIDAADEAEFDDTIATLKEKSLYDTGITAEYGDQLVMLVTCSSHTANGRFVLVGRYRKVDS